MGTEQVKVKVDKKGQLYWDFKLLKSKPKKSKKKGS